MSRTTDNFFEPPNPALRISEIEVKPKIRPRIKGVVVYTVAAHPERGTLHLALLGGDGEYHLYCTGARIDQSWADAPPDDMDYARDLLVLLTCQKCSWGNVRWDRGGLRRATFGRSFFVY